MLIQSLNIQKSVLVLDILTTLFWRCIDIVPDSTYLDADLISFLHSLSFVDPFSNVEVFISVVPSSAHSSPIKDVIQARLNPVVEIMEGFEFLGAGLNVVSKFLAEGALPTVVWKVSIDGCSFSDIPFLWSVYGSGGNRASSVVAWSGL